MIERTEAQKVLQLPLIVMVGGSPKPVRPRTMAESDAWVANSLVAQIIAIWGKVNTIASWEDAVNQLAGSSSAMLICVLEYDTEGALGGYGPDEDPIHGSWLYNNATPAEIWEAVKVLGKSAFPFAQDVTKWAPSFVSLLMAEVAKASRAPATSMPKPSAPGDVSPRKSTRR
jgi:hypothetical protein